MNNAREATALKLVALLSIQHNTQWCAKIYEWRWPTSATHSFSRLEATVLFSLASSWQPLRLAEKHLGHYLVAGFFITV